MNRISIAIFILFGASAAVSCGGNKQQQRPAQQAVPVSTGKVSEEIVTGTSIYPGSVVPLN